MQFGYAAALVLAVLAVLSAIASATNPVCADPVRYYNGVDVAKRNQTIGCAMRALDTNHDDSIDKAEYDHYVSNVVLWIKRPACPSWDTICGKCDCNGNKRLTANELLHATQSCLESNFWINRVHDQTC
jgi:hypothetical protein